MLSLHVATIQSAEFLIVWKKKRFVVVNAEKRLIAIENMNPRRAKIRNSVAGFYPAFLHLFPPTIDPVGPMVLFETLPPLPRFPGPTSSLPPLQIHLFYLTTQNH